MEERIELTQAETEKLLLFFKVATMEELIAQVGDEAIEKLVRLTRSVEQSAEKLRTVRSNGQ